MKARAQATCETGLEGKGLTSASEPRSSISSCQPGNVERRSKVKEEEMMEMNLRIGICEKTKAGFMTGDLLWSLKMR